MSKPISKYEAEKLISRYEAEKMLQGKNRVCMRVGELLVCLGYIAEVEAAAAAVLNLTPVVILGEANWYDLKHMHWTKRPAWILAKQLRGEI